MIKRTLTVLNQLGLGNAGLLTVHYASEVRPIVEDMVVELVDQELQQPFLELISIVPVMPEQNGAAMKTFGDVICSISSESKNKSEFEFMIELQMRVFRIWKTVEKADVIEESIRDNCYRHAAAAAAQNKTQEWAKSSGTSLPIANISSLSQGLYDMMLSGKYFLDEVYNLPVEMSTNGEIVLCDTVPEDEWAEVFDGLNVQ